MTTPSMISGQTAELQFPARFLFGAATASYQIASWRRSPRSATVIGTGSVALGPLFRTLHAAGRDDVIYAM